MKKLLTLFSIAFLAISFSAMAQDKNEDILGESGVYEEVIQVPNVSQEELYKRAKTWILENMQTDDNNILFDDKEFTINNNGSLKVDPKSTFMWVIKAGVLNFKFHVWVKEGKYKFKIDNVAAHLIVHANNAIAPKIILYSEFHDSKQGPYALKQANERFPVFISAFKKGMTSSVKEKNDW